MGRFISQSSAVDPLILSQTEVEKRKATWRDYVEMTKPGINMSNLFTAFTGYFLASGFVSFHFVTWACLLLGTALVIAGSCVFNNYMDRDIDPKMERTRSRPIPTGKIRPVVALWYGMCLSVVGLCVLWVGVNPLCAILGASGSLIYVGVYTWWLKRTSTLSTVIGGVCGAVPPVMGWVAVTGSLDVTAWVLFLILFLWQPPHFFALAMLKVEDYRAANIPMLPVIKGFVQTKIQTLVFVGLLIPASVALFFTHAAGGLYLGVALVLGITYLALSVQGFTAKEDQRWARQMFFYSLLYLPALMLSLILDVALRYWIGMG